MNSSKNNILTLLVVLLLIANIASIAIFWLGKGKPPNGRHAGSPASFLIKALQFDSIQQQKFSVLRQEHHDSAEKIREEIKDGKKRFFDLLKTTNLSDTAIQTAAKVISIRSEKLDLLTFNHFQKVRAICSPAQQQKFDDIILEMTNMIASQQPQEPRRRMPPPPESAERDEHP
jgi:periplasmic protein CpxP/Spy